MKTARRLLSAKNGRPSLAQALFVLGGARLGRGNVGSRFFDCALGLIVAFFQNTP